MPREVLLVQRILPPYRFRFFQALARSPVINLTIGFGGPSPDSGLDSVDAPAEARRLVLRNRFFGPNERAVWSSGLMAQLWRPRFYVMIAEFNPRILSNVIACILARITGTRFIWWGHGLSHESADSKWVARIRLKLISLSSAVILYEEAMARKLVELGVSRGKIHVARNTIDTQTIGALRSQEFPSNRFRILYTGRLVPGKKLHLLVRAFADAMPTLDPAVRLTIIGDGTEADTLEAEIQRLGLEERLELLPGIYDETELAPYFNSALFSVTPGYVGLSVIHCLAYGVPVVTAQNEPHSPEFAALENGVNARLISRDSVTELSSALVELAEEKEHLEMLHRNSLESAAKWEGVENMVAVFEEAITQVSGGLGN